MKRKIAVALRIVAIVACIGCAETVGSMAVRGEAPHWLKLCGLVSLVTARMIAGNARYAEIRSIAR